MGGEESFGCQISYLFSIDIHEFHSEVLPESKIGHTLCHSKTQEHELFHCIFYGEPGEIPGRLIGQIRICKFVIPQYARFCVYGILPPGLFYIGLQVIGTIPTELSCGSYQSLTQAAVCPGCFREFAGDGIPPSHH